MDNINLHFQKKKKNKVRGLDTPENFQSLLKQGENSKFYGIWKSISEQFPSRKKLNLYHHAYVSWADYKRTPWTSEENERFLKLVDKYGRNWKAIGIKMDRPHHLLPARYRFLTERASSERNSGF